MKPTLRTKLGCWLHERWRTELALLTGGWEGLRNRGERLDELGGGAWRCRWTDSSTLTVARVFPRVGGRLLERCLDGWPLRLASAEHRAETRRNVPRISVILPVGGLERAEQFRTVLAALAGQSLREFEILVVEHAEAPRYAGLCPPGVRRIFVPRHPAAEFNKCLALNAGARAATAPYLLLHDADVVPPAHYLERIVAHLDTGWEAVRPVRFLFGLKRAASETFIASSGRVLPREVDFVQQNFPGASTAITREGYERIGGHDERFEGWGGEDVEFLDRLRTLRLRDGGFAPVIHLWHRPAPRKASGDRNNDLMDGVRAVPVAERITALREPPLPTPACA